MGLRCGFGFWSPGVGIAVEAGGLFGAAGPEGGQGGGVAEFFGGELRQIFAACFGPKLLAAFDAAVDLFHRRLHPAAGDGQASEAIRGVVHARLLVGQVGQCLSHDFSRIGLGGDGRRWAEFELSLGQFGDDLGHLALPDPRHPAQVDHGSLCGFTTRHRSRVDIGQRMNNIEDRDERASLIAWGQVMKAMTQFFGTEYLLKDVTSAKAEEFRQSMLTGKLRATTVHKRLQHARLCFTHAKRLGLVTANPFEFVRHRPGDASERRAYVPAKDVWRVVEYTPNADWKLLIVLSRFAGLRVPSEALSLRWRDVDWERSRLTVPSPKTEHLAGKGHRIIPLFPEIRKFLDEVFELAADGAEFVFPEEFRRRSHGPGGWKNANFRTSFEKIIRRAGLETWSRLWHSMRASCETDLARLYPLAVVAKWLGNTQAVAMRHSVDVTDADFERAAQGSGAHAAQNEAQYPSEAGGNGGKVNTPENTKAPEFPGLSLERNSLQSHELEAAGIEPAS